MEELTKKEMNQIKEITDHHDNIIKRILFTNDDSPLETYIGGYLEILKERSRIVKMFKLIDLTREVRDAIQDQPKTSKNEIKLMHEGAKNIRKKLEA